MGARPHDARNAAGARLTSTAIALRNLRRRPFRSLGIASAMAVMSGSLLAIAVAFQSVSSAAGRGMAKLGADLVVVPRAAPLATSGTTAPMSSTPRYLDYSVVDELKNIQVIVPQYGGRPPISKPAVAAATAQLSLVVPGGSAVASPPLHVVGFEPDSDLSVLPWLTDTRTQPLASADALIGHLARHTVGDRIDLQGIRVRVVGVLGKTGMDEIDRAIFVPLPTAWRILRRLDIQANGVAPEPPAKPVTTIEVRSAEGVSAQQAANFIRSGIAGVSPKTLHRAMNVLGTQLRAGIRNMALIGIVIWAMTLLLMGAAFAMLVRERQREVGLLRAMGARRADIAGLLAKEVCTLCTVGGALGVAIGVAASSGINGVIEAYFGIAHQGPGWTQLAIIALVCLAIAPTTGLLAALAPSIRASVMDPHTAINEGP